MRLAEYSADSAAAKTYRGGDLRTATCVLLDQKGDVIRRPDPSTARVICGAGGLRFLNQLKGGPDMR
jgi:hypothetical protein